ncbi:MAG: hypothetical protein KBC57_01220 [Neisseriaceae bacterium]|nr:hypothetical protein [Neisseriaceae bacterium]
MPDGVLGTYLSERFPVVIRAYSMGMAYKVGRIGAIMAPIATGFSFLSLGLVILYDPLGAGIKN